MIIQKYLPSLVCGILLGFLLDKTISNIAKKYKFNNAMRITFHITCVMMVIYIMENIFAIILRNGKILVVEHYFLYHFLVSK